MQTKNGVWKRLCTLVLAAGMILGFLVVNPNMVSAAEKLDISIKKYQKTYKLDDGTVYYEATYEYPVVSGDSEAAKKINVYIEKQKKKWIKNSKKAQKMYEQDYVSMRQNNEGPSFSWYFTDEVTCEIETNNEEYLSIMQLGYVYTGGAHGLPYRTCTTFDVKTGKKLTAAKILGISKIALNKKVCNLYLEKYAKEGEEAGFFMNGKSGVKKALKDINFNNAFYMKNGKLVFYVDPYVLGPYAAGFIEVTASLK